MYWLGLIGIPAQIYALWIARRVVDGTSLVAAWWWALLAVCIFAITALLATESSGLVDHLAYSSVICCLAPAIAVLGARRPRIAAWSGFVVLPMIVVLHWPAVSQLITGSIGDAFELPMPTCIGVCLVMIMGLGNYFGTRFTLPVILLASGLILILRSLSQPDTVRSPDLHQVIPLAGILISIASLLFAVRSKRLATPVPAPANQVRDELNLVWHDFQELFGIVWAKRVMDRVNQFAQRESWPVQLELIGFRTQQSEEPISPATVDRIRWILRQFVDPAWLDSRLAKGQNVTIISEPTVEPEHRKTAD